MLSISLILSSSVLVGLALYVSPYFGLIAWVPTLLLSMRSNGKTYWLSGVSNALLLGITILWWVYDYNQIHFAVALLVWVGFYLSYAIVSVAFKKIGVGMWQAPLVAWALSGYLFLVLGLGSFWNELSIFLPVTGSLIATIGSFGVSMLLFASQALIAEFIHRRAAKHLLWSIFLTGSLLGFHINTINLNSTERISNKAKPFNIAIVQANIDASWEWRVSNIDYMIDLLASLTEIAGTNKPPLIIWPEYSVPVDFVNLRPKIRERLTALQQSFDTTLVVGTVLAVAGQPGKHYDSAVVLDGSQNFERSHAKRLIAFNENTVAAKRKTTILNSTQSAGVLICYEELFKDIAREQAQAGAKYLIALSNNRGFGYGGELVLKFSALRAAENQRSLIRASNTGVSTVFDIYGRRGASLDTNERGVLADEVHPNSNITIFTKLGDFPTQLAILFVVLISLFRGNKTLSGSSGQGKIY